MDLDQILDKLIADVEMSIHGFYRGEVRQDTQRVRSDRQRGVARQAIMALMAEAASHAGTAPPVGSQGGPSVAPEEIAALTRCVIAWLPMGAPSTTNPASRCMPAARELAPTWGEREKANVALKHLAR